MATNPAIVISAYNQPASLSRLLASVESAIYTAADIPLIISIDKSDEPEVRAIAEAFHWKHGDKRIILHEAPLGLKQHILSCGNLSLVYGAILLLEDDLLVS